MSLLTFTFGWSRGGKMGRSARAQHSLTQAQYDLTRHDTTLFMSWVEKKSPQVVPCHTVNSICAVIGQKKYTSYYSAMNIKFQLLFICTVYYSLSTVILYNPSRLHFDELSRHGANNNYAVGQTTLIYFTMRTVSAQPKNSHVLIFHGSCWLDTAHLPPLG